MKKVFVIVLSMVIVATASAQTKGGGHYYRGGGRYYHPHTRVIVGLGAGYYSPYYYPFYYPPYDYGYRMPSRLELKIEDIRADYRGRIYSARHDKSISKSERKATIHQLKSDRDLAVRDAERNYYKSYDNSPGASSER
jgi:hypothetical protein